MPFTTYKRVFVYKSLPQEATSSNFIQRLGMAETNLGFIIS